MHFSWVGFEKDSRGKLAETIKKYHEFSETEDYNIVRNQKAPLTLNLFCAILPASHGGKHTCATCHLYERRRCCQ
jgi:hypothetical protein